MTEPRRPVTVLAQRRRVIRGDASLIVGLPRSAALQYLVLLAAAAVDVVAFNQILTQALDEYEWVLWGFVGGFTVVCLALSHTAGRQWKEASEHRHAPNARAIATVSAAIWLALGAAAFLFRWLYVAPVATGTVVEFEDQTQSQAQVPDEAVLGSHMSAILFLVLYLATGVLSGAMAYKLHNPAAQQWARAVAKRAKVAVRLARLEAALVAAEVLVEQVGDMRERAMADKSLFLDLPDSLTDKVIADAELKMRDHGMVVRENRKQITGADADGDDQQGKDER